MSATTITISSTKRPGGPASMVAALPSDLSHSPLLGILGVVMGAGIVPWLAACYLSVWRISKGMWELGLMTEPGSRAHSTPPSCSSGRSLYIWEPCWERDELCWFPPQCLSWFLLYFR